MKKKIVLLIVCIGMLIFVACGKEVNIGDETMDTTGISETISVSSEVKNTETIFVEDKTEILEGVYKFPDPKIYVNVPNYNDIEKGFTMIYKDGEKKYVTFSCFRNDTAQNAAEAFDVSYPQFQNNVSSWHWIKSDPVVSTDSVVVNEIETCKIKGTVECGAVSTTNCFICGYSFIFEDVPCAIIGVVSDKTQPQEEIDELITIVDAMMESVRTEP